MRRAAEERSKGEAPRTGAKRLSPPAPDPGRPPGEPFPEPGTLAEVFASRDLKKAVGAGPDGKKFEHYVVEHPEELPTVSEGALDGQLAVVISTGSWFVFDADPTAFRGGWTKIPSGGDVFTEARKAKSRADARRLAERLRGKRMRPPPGVAVPTSWLEPPKHPMAKCDIDLTAEDPPTRVDPAKVKRLKDKVVADRFFGDGSKASAGGAPEVRVGGRFVGTETEGKADAILQFGKYRGQKVSRLVVETPETRDYLRWVFGEDFSDELKEIIEFWFNRWGYKT